PLTSYNTLKAAGKTKMTIWGGTITSMSFVTTVIDYTGDKSEQLVIVFNATSSTVVFGWGGHIGSQDDWGPTNSAVAVTGSPYHTRLISIDGSGGNQDRS